MPKELPRIDLEHPSDLDYITHAVNAYANDIGKEHMRARGRQGSALEDTLDHALERQATAVEPFDESLANRVNQLSENVDEMTESVVEYRRAVPAAYAKAVKRRAEALDALANAREDQRQRKLRKSKPRTHFPALAMAQPLTGMRAQHYTNTTVDADAKERIGETLHTVYANMAHLESVRGAPVCLMQVFTRACKRCSRPDKAGPALTKYALLAFTLTNAT
ncbi:hypothetical protein MVES1_000019 [Malassezia vespertilionis]|uniref:uncharacterized protein n=1 Tax=Malassezia vespertilionis TaxID=2020962 RepID=UPI0024B2257D|nr:uncharacterized protein MVES1_000019 [Malassezia vespertilionis]WFD04696.1 hypothetical protein MVES1_000019 [Malassezia vespertilionis]